MAQLRRVLPMRALVIVAVAGTALAAVAARGPDQPAGPQEKSPLVVLAQPEAMPLISVEFKGGTVAEYIEALRGAAAPAPVNTITSEPASKVRLAPVRLKNVALEMAIQAIEPAAGRESGSWDIRRLMPLSKSQMEIGTAVYSIDYKPRPSGTEFTAGAVSPGGPTDRSFLQIYSLRDVTDPRPGDPPGVPLTQRPETVLTAVNTAIQLSAVDGLEEAQLKYHADSGLLIFRGTPAQAGLVQQALEKLSADVRERRVAAIQMGLSGRSVADLRAELERARLIVTKHEMEAARAGEAASRLKAMVDLGTVPPGEVADMELRAQSAGIEARMAQVEVSRLEERLRGMEHDDAAPGRASTRNYDLSGWGAKASGAASAVAATLEKASAAVGEGHGGSAKFDSKAGTCIVTGAPWAQDLARRMLSEFARANGLAFEGGPAAGPGSPPAPPSPPPETSKRK